MDVNTENPLSQLAPSKPTEQLVLLSRVCGQGLGAGKACFRDSACVQLLWYYTFL